MDCCICSHLAGIPVFSCNEPLNINDFDSEEEFQTFRADSLGVDSCLLGDSLIAAALPGPSQAFLSQNNPQDSLVYVYLYQANMDSL